jgi:hypothetical protein
MSLAPEVHWDHIQRRHPEVRLDDVVDAFTSPEIATKEIIREEPEDRIAFIKKKRSNLPANYVVLIISHDISKPTVITAYYTNHYLNK